MKFTLFALLASLVVALPTPAQSALERRDSYDYSDYEANYDPDYESAFDPSTASGYSVTQVATGGTLQTSTQTDSQSKQGPPYTQQDYINSCIKRNYQLCCNKLGFKQYGTCLGVESVGQCFQQASNECKV
ncbi:hypothetical protein HDU91_001139 [Kappamyces sp. JEL0680]|nr:hypothetical protein HDU91_001139 [Kappamyces sp. JEL0680]